MEGYMMRGMFVWTLLMICLLLATLAQAQQGGKAKGDDSGTNPINFTYDFRIWNETQDLQGENTFSKMTFEYRFPLSKTWAGRFRGYVPTLNLAGQSFHGLGDVDMRVLHIPLLRKKWALVLGLGLGVGKIFTVGTQIVNAQIAAFYNVESPTGGAAWTIRPQISFIFPQ